MALIEITDECIEWPLARDRRDGYGVIQYGGAFSKAYRLVYHLFNGPIPPKMSVMHTCDNRLCVNPSHLKLGTHGENMRDMVLKGRHSCGRLQKNAKLSDDIVRKLRSREISVKEAAVMTGAAITTLYQARSGEKWKHVK